MNRRFIHYLKIVAAAHIGAVLLFMLISGGRILLRRKTEVRLPVEFVVEAPAAPVVTEMVTTVPEEKEPEPEPKPASRRRLEIIKSNKRVTRSIKRKPLQRRQLSDEEIKKLLAQGAKPAEHTSVPDDDDARYDLIVHNELYAAWNAPNIEMAGDNAAKVSIRLAKDGRIIARKLVKESGNALMDSSVMQAVNAVQKIRGLSVGYLARNEWVTIVFRVK